MTVGRDGGSEAFFSLIFVSKKETQKGRINLWQKKSWQ